MPPTFLLLPPDPGGRTDTVLVRLASVERVWRTSPSEGQAATLQVVTFSDGQRLQQHLRGPAAEAVWAQLLALEEAEWGALRRASEREPEPGQAQVQQVQQAQRRQAQAVAALFNRQYPIGQPVEHVPDGPAQPRCQRTRTRSEAWASEDNLAVVLLCGVAEPVLLAQVEPVLAQVEPVVKPSP